MGEGRGGEGVEVLKVRNWFSIYTFQPNRILFCLTRLPRRSLHPGSYGKSIRSVAAVATCDDGDGDDDDDNTYRGFTDRFQTLKAFYNLKEI